MIVALFFPLNSLTIFSSVGIISGIYLFVRGFRLLARKRLLLNTPTSKIRSASLGLVEVSGLATGPYTITAPITGKPCYLYRTTAWQERKSGKNNEWDKVAEETLHVPFFLDDTTGQLLVDPLGAELDIHRDLREEYNNSFFSSRDPVPPAVGVFLARNGVTPARRVRIEEWAIKPKNALFIAGTLAENPGVDVQPLSFAAEDAGHSGTTESAARRRPVPAPPQEVIQLSSPANAPAAASDMTQQSKIAAALAKAGITNPAAWAAAGVPYPGTPAAVPAPQVTEIKVNSKDPAGEPEEVSGFNLKPPVVLMKGQNDPTFLISWRSQKEVVGSLAWKSTAMVWGGGGLVVLGLYVLLSQMQLL